MKPTRVWFSNYYKAPTNTETVYLSRIDNPEDFPDMRSYTIKPRWLMSAVLWVLKRLGFKVYDMREKK